jgi:hypothetical protein
MSLERIAVATAVLSAALSAGGLLLAWHRGSTERRPRLARTLGGLTLLSAIGLLVALGFASTGGEKEAGPARARALTADEYRLRLIAVCEDHEREAERIGKAEGDKPVFGPAVQLETRTTEKLVALRPPQALDGDHRAAVALWGRRLSLLGHYYDRLREESGDPAFRREFARALKRVDRLTRALERRFDALGVTPECAIFS